MAQERNYNDECGDHGGTNRDGDPCGRPAGWGTDFDSGKCKNHRGTNADGSSHEGNDYAKNNDGGAPEKNGNALGHGARADPLNLYENLEGEGAEWVDTKVEAYREEAGLSEGTPTADLVKLAVMHLFQSYRAHGQLAKEGVDRTSVVGTTEDGAITDEEEHYLNSIASRHTGDFRMAIKDAGVLNDPDSQKADAVGDLASIIADES